MTKPALVVMAAGLGSRYGGLKQIVPVDAYGHLLMDYAVYDAYRAGFKKVVCVIAADKEKDFRQIIGDRIAGFMDIQYAVQSLDALPPGFSVPEGRSKPWGTAHAVLCAKSNVNGNFAVINADDYYGPRAFSSIYKYLTEEADSRHHAMVGYHIENTLTENGHVARGVCKTDSDGNLLEIIERTRIEPDERGAVYIEDDGNRVFLPNGTIVSLNVWGFGHSVLDEIEERLPRFLKENLPDNPLGREFFLPSVSDALLREGKATVKVLPTPDKWYGVTYADDMPKVRAALEKLREAGQYPEKLWADKGDAKC